MPRLRPPSRVLIASLTYNEYAHAWARHGHTVCAAPPKEFPERLAQADVLIVCNPNNPTGDRFAVSQLLKWHAALSSRGGWLIVDEAYIDPTPGRSLAPYSDRPGLVVLRSLGKFFGLAGARVGFALASATLLGALEAELGPWCVAGPARYVACTALSDRAWQSTTRRALANAGGRLRRLLSGFGIATAGTVLFQWWWNEAASNLHRALAREAILTRLFQHQEPRSIRIGLPGSDSEWERLEQALAHWQSR